FSIHGTEYIGKAYYYCHLEVGKEHQAVAVVSVYSKPHPDLLGESSGTLYISCYLGDNNL
ncbi:hypothetical protein AX16_000827, partial [Volvariella volvacea WC 439]